MDFPIGHEQTKFSERLYTINPNLHTLIIGKSGTGKSTLMLNKARWHIAEGDGILFLDPHGDAAQKLERHIPPHRLEDVVIVNPLSGYVLGLNPFVYKTQEDIQLSVNSLMTMTKNLAGASGWGDESEKIANMAAQSVAHYVKEPTVLDLYRFVEREAFRGKLAKRSRDPMLADFIRQYDEDLRASERAAKFSPIMNKFDKYLRPFVRTMLCQRTCFDFLEAMNTHKIVIVKLPIGRLGKTSAAIIGSVILMPCAKLCQLVLRGRHVVD